MNLYHRLLQVERLILVLNDFTNNPTYFIAIDYERLIRERDEYIRQLRQENEMHLHQNQSVVSQKLEVENTLKQSLMRMNSEFSVLQDEVSNLSKANYQVTIQYLNFYIA